MSLALFSEIDFQQAIVRQPLVVSLTTSVIEALTLMSQVRGSCSLNCSLGDQANSESFVLTEAQGSCVLVMEGAQLLGIFTERDVIRLSAEGRQLTEVALSEVMTPSVITLQQSEFTDLFMPMNLLQQHRIRHLPILDDKQQVVGLLTHESLQQLLQPINLFRLRLVSEVMICKVVSAKSTDSVLSLTQRMAKHRVSSIVVVEERQLEGSNSGFFKIPVGVITERDIVQFQALGLNFEQIQASHVMSQPVFSVPPDDSLLSVRSLMQTYRVSRVVVVGKQGELVGIVTQSTLLQTLSPIELYKQLEGLEERVSQLEAEKLELLQQRTVELEAEIVERTAEIRSGAEREKLLSIISNRIRASLNLPDTLNAIVTEVRQWLECDRVMIYQFQPDWTGTVLAESVTAGWKSFLGHTVVDPCFATNWVEPYSNGRIRVVNDIMTDMMTSCHRDLLIMLEVRAKILLPIIVNDRLWGLILAAQNDALRYWKAEEIELVQQISTQAAIAIQQAELYQQAQIELQERQRTETLLRESKKLYRTTLSTISDAVFMTDDTGHLTFIGPNVHILFGYTVTEVWDMGSIDTLLGSTLFDLQQLTICGEIANIEQEIQDKQGRLHTVLVNVKRVQIGEGTILYSCRDISDRKQAEIILRQSERRYASLTEASPVGIFRTDTSGHCLYVNDRWCQIAGLKPQEALGAGWKQGLHLDDQDIITAEWYQAAQENRPFRLEYRFQRPDGTITCVYGQAVAEQGENGEIIGYVGTITDITARIQAEKQVHQLNVELEQRVEQRTAELAQANQLLTLVMDSIPQRIFWKDRNSVFLGCNRNFAQDAGLTPEEVVGKGTDELSSTLAEVEHYFECDRRVMATGEPELHILETLHKPDGSYLWLETNKVPLRETDGTIIGILATYEDITERKQMELALQESQYLIQRITEASPDILYIYDLQERQMVYSNRGIASVLNYLAAEVNALGNNLFIPLVHPDDLPKVREYHARFTTASDTDILELEYRLRDRQGNWHWFISRATVFTRDAEQRPKQIVGAASEITERKQIDAELRQTNAELARATRLKDEFLANMSHELRTPLNAILGMSEGLQEKIFGSLTERQQHAVSTIESSGRHLLELINDILDLAKIEAGKFELQIAPVSASSLCQSSLAFIKQQAMQKRIQLQITIQPNLQEIAVDERRMRQVLINLLNNAVKFTTAGGKVTLEVNLRREDMMASRFAQSAWNLSFSVTDTGIGIAPEELGNLFQSFVQIDSSLNRQQDGTGLGLALVKRITELHGGQVSVTSEIGKGSCFTVCLPYVDGSGVAQPLPEAAPAQARLPVSCSEPAALTALTRILLVEDNEANVYTITGYLGSRGYQMILATNGQEAVDLAKAQLPDLILMDIQMPGIDGLEATRLIRLEPALAKIPIIALTALAMPGDRDLCLEAGATDYMTKPVRLKQLASLIQQLLQP